MYKNRSQGFTLIELLVVIAIIGVLSAVVLASLNSARTKGTDAAIKSNVDSARAQAELYYDDQPTKVYEGVCTAAAADLGIAAMVSGATAAGSASVVCDDEDATWILSAQLKTDPTKYWCVDSTGAARQTGAQIVAGTDTECPAAG